MVLLSFNGALQLSADKFPIIMQCGGPLLLLSFAEVAHIDATSHNYFLLFISFLLINISPANKCLALALAVFVHCTTSGVSFLQGACVAIFVNAHDRR